MPTITYRPSSLRSEGNSSLKLIARSELSQSNWILQMWVAFLFERIKRPVVTTDSSFSSHLIIFTVTTISCIMPSPHPQFKELTCSQSVSKLRNISIYAKGWIEYDGAGNIVVEGKHISLELSKEMSPFTLCSNRLLTSDYTDLLSLKISDDNEDLPEWHTKKHDPVLDFRHKAFGSVESSSAAPFPQCMYSQIRLSKVYNSLSILQSLM